MATKLERIKELEREVAELRAEVDRLRAGTPIWVAPYRPYPQPYITWTDSNSYDVPRGMPCSAKLTEHDAPDDAFPAPWTMRLTQRGA